MPQNLDESTQKIVLAVTSFTTLAIVVPAVYAQFVMIPNLRRRLDTNSSSGPSSLLLVGCLKSLTLMILATVFLTVPILYYSHHEPSSNKQSLSSSINFCEEDFRHSKYIAEPANVVSSLTSYVPLALLGLLGRPSKQYRHPKLRRRFMIIYTTLLCIGLGSMALHSLLTAKAQSGDELPMLWYTAAASFCALDVVFHQNKGERRRRWLSLTVVVLSAVAATVTYILQRDDFTIFYIIFSLYSQTMVFSIVWICFGIDWEQQAAGESDRQRMGIQFKANVLFPLAISAGWSTILAIWVWGSEMLYCNKVMQDRAFGEVIAPFVWNRVVHPMWHFTSGLLAWLLVQVLLAAHGMQQGWGTPSLEWCGAPYVVFQTKKVE